MKYYQGDLVRNTVLNKSGVVVAHSIGNPQYVQVQYADGSRLIHDEKILELNPTENE